MDSLHLSSNSSSGGSDSGSGSSSSSSSSSQSSPTNIHYNSENHWVTSFQFEYLLDGDLGKKRNAKLNDFENSVTSNIWPGKVKDNS